MMKNKQEGNTLIFVLVILCSSQSLVLGLFVEQ